VGFIKGEGKYQEATDCVMDENDEHLPLPEIRYGNLDWINNYTAEELSKLQF
jgi:hypothetical protein